MSSRSRYPRASVLVAVLAVIGSFLATPPASATAVTGAAFTGTSGTWTSAGGTVYARQGAILTLTVTTDAQTQCLEVYDGANALVGTQAAAQPKASWTFADATTWPWLRAGSGNGTQAFTVKGYKNVNAGICGSPKNDSFTLQTAAYTLDNTAPTATGSLSPVPNGAGWNKADVTVTWTGDDPGGSGVESVTPATDTVTADGVVTRTTTVTDHVGNSATSAPVTVRLDKTAPTIEGSRAPAPNAAGWNNTDVMVSFAAGDSTSGVSTVTAPTVLSGNGAGQSVTGTATDNAGNSSSATVSGINIDKGAPSLVGTPTTAPNAAGWYRGDVRVAWTATDALSGTSNPADSTVGGEGTGLTASATATDAAGNSTGSVQSAPVRIDRTPPLTTATAPPAWNRTDVTLSLVANDGLSGVARTEYVLDGGGTATGTSVAVTTEGQHTLEFWSTDAAGNVEPHRSVTFAIDKTTPTIGHIQEPAANADGWNNTAVTVKFTCTDALSGVASCTGPQDVTTEGDGQVVTGTVVDYAGNTATDPATVNIDLTPPSITVDELPSPNARGWYAADVTATFTATDDLSGIKTQDHQHTFGEGAGQTATATATDVAGNSDSVTTPEVNVDLTPPTIGGKVVEEPNAHGWFRRDVTVRWTCHDRLSGVDACPEDTPVGGEGPDLAATAGVSDLAGHTTYATVRGIRIDRTPPATAATGVPGGWVDAPVTVDLVAVDNLSDVETTWFRVDGAEEPTRGSTVTVGGEGVHTVEYWSVDGAGNREEPQSFTVRLDLSAPEIVAAQSPDANEHGWNNTDVAVSFSCLDQSGLSGLDHCPAPETLAGEGAAQQVTGTATDHAGNRASATATVNIDKTPPVVTGAPDRAPNAAGWYDDDVAVSFTAKDPLSGVDLVTGLQHVGEGPDQRVDGSATDNAGNLAAAAVTGLNVDKTAPDLSAAPTTAPNEQGWYNHAVTLVWAASDGLSGLAGDLPTKDVLSGEGRSQSVFATVRDVAGNATTASSAPVDIDLTAPTTNASAPGGWVNGDVEVTLTPHDVLSGVESTHYRVDGGALQQGRTVSLSGEGTHTIAFASTDAAGNVEDEHSVTVRIDRSAPTITHDLAPRPNGNGWNNSDVTVTFTCDDQADLSGVASCTAPQPVTDEPGRPVTGTATDHAGNSATLTATVRLDRTPPRIVGSRTPAANAHGWNNSPVTVHFDASDALSGLEDVTADVPLGEGSEQSVEGTALDAAGNTATDKVGGVNVDLTAPTLRGAPTTAANDAGWYRGNVTIGWTADDDGSGVLATPAPAVLTGEGPDLRETATVSDLAGNTTTADSVAVNIDRTAPTTGADAPAGWSNGPVTVSLKAADGLSGVEATYYAVDGGDAERGTSLTLAAEGRHTLRYWSVDVAGNAEAAHEVEVKVDLTRPTITHTLSPAPNARGWSNRPVTVRYACNDVLSGVDSCSPEVTVTTDGLDQVVPGRAVDAAGNVRTDDATVSIDTVDPTISGGPDRRANARGWYDADVVVAFTCDDVLSGIADCTAPVRLHEGGGQSTRGTATDAAGNSRSLEVGPVDIDETAPSLSAEVLGEPNPAGWFSGDVTVRWTAHDVLSGLDGAPPADTILDGEGPGLTATATVRDLAGNSTTTTSAPVQLDRTPPSTSLSHVSEWNNHAVTVDLVAGDNLSGVEVTHYQLDDQPVAEGTSVTIDAEGVHLLRVWSVDVAGNVEPRQSLEVKVDRTAPGIAHAQSPAANGRGWNNTEVRVTFTCTDAGSGVADCTAPVTLGEGAAQLVVGTATDRAGNTATDETTVNVDRTRPTVTGGLSAAPNAHGWFAGDVVATFACADQDGLSGVVSCPEPVTLHEGGGQRAGGTATDAADNDSEPFELTGIDVDKTRPTLAGETTWGPNAHDWYRGDVVVRWTADDALSGLDGPVPANSVVTGEGESLSASATVRDLAGNTRTVTVGGLRIDRTAPSTHATAPTGWQATDVTVRLTATDALSGVASTHYRVDGGPAQDGTSVTVDREGTHQVSFWSVDEAGNAETPATVTVLVDKTAPTIAGATTTSPNAAGWYAGPVTVAFTCADSPSGVGSCQQDTTVSAQGQNAVTGTAVDNAGNTSSTTVDGIRIDTVAPAVTLGGVTDGATYVLGAVPAATVSATDATSGLASDATVATSGGLANGVGTFAVRGTATDRAGNTGTATLSYRVVYGYGSTLFLQPVNDTAHQTGLSTSVFNAGQSIPMKFRLQNAAGQVVQAGSAPRWLVPVRGSSTSAAVNESAYTAPATLGSTYTWDGSQYLYVWKTEKSQAGSYWRVGVALDDGQTYYVNVGLR